jgi:sulfite exporter TauE/SafE
MTLFWAGTLPALFAAPWVVERILRPARQRSPRLAAMVLILAGLAGLGFKMNTLLASSDAKGAKPSCHCEKMKAAGGH